MNTEVATTAKLDLSVLTAEQGALLDKLKLYTKAEDQTRLERKALAYLKGRAANALEAITEHGLFNNLIAITFPENSLRWLRYCRDFAAAVDIGKNAPLKYLPDNRLLKPGDLSEDEKEKVAHALEKVTGEKGIKAVIKDYKKKLAREKAKDAPPIDAVTREKAHQESMALIGTTALESLRRYVELKLADKALVPVTTRKEIDAMCVRNGREAKQLKTYKPAKA